MTRIEEREAAARPLIPVVIDRRRWLRGEGPDASRLLRKTDGKMCCLGFVCEAVGVSAERLVNRGTPRVVVSGVDGLAVRGELIPDGLAQLLQHADAVADAMRVNDYPAGMRRLWLRRDDPDPNAVDEAREAELTQLLASCGFALEFAQ